MGILNVTCHIIIVIFQHYCRTNSVPLNTCKCLLCPQVADGKQRLGKKNPKPFCSWCALDSDYPGFAILDTGEKISFIICIGIYNPIIRKMYIVHCLKKKP